MVAPETTTDAARTAECPPWCNGEHEPRRDRRIAHRSEGIIVPGVERVVHHEGDSLFSTVIEIAIGLEHIDDETWVWFGSDNPSRPPTVLSIESTRRLLRAVEALIRDRA
ncbi:DUF6907 domain-containing protein [Microbacterium trichothecenolyticum]|uniref:Uncharacterized protein n=1 Tax=Microbacterium trichothecenolyticum TaxID=69370 RepID=A0ABU0TQ80_MICTR|nr:hypothetical protein [Microbacterium trichothecenolyticum]MDQ1121829.1 hypothetical protein [Microbacterium trichothecenolyticum]